MNKAKMGNVAITSMGDAEQDRQFECDCGATEYVVDYNSGKNTPKKFEFWMGFKKEHAKCLTCGVAFDSQIGAQYS
jgi:hypothetical protein